MRSGAETCFQWYWSACIDFAVTYRPSTFVRNSKPPHPATTQRLTAILQVACCPDFAATSMRRVFRAPGAYPLSPLEDPLTPDSRHLKRRVPVLDLSFPALDHHMFVNGQIPGPISPGLICVCPFHSTANTMPHSSRWKPTPGRSIR